MESNKIIIMSSEDFSVYVSRLPLKWDDAKLKEHFEICFGPVSGVSIKYDEENDRSMCYGFVNFVNAEDKNKAVEQGSMHVKKRTIHIRPFVPKDIQGKNDCEHNDLRNSNICFLWKRNACVRGDSCKFSHEGEGSCVKVSEPFQGKTRKCLSFKTKGKCSKGDSCPFQHIAGSNISINKDKILGNGDSTEAKDMQISTLETENNLKKKGMCHTFQKKGKCRKGDSCLFTHILIDKKKLDSNNDEVSAVTKKRKLDGEELVKIRKQKILLDKNKVE